MKTSIFALLFLLFYTTNSFAQNVREATVKYNKAEQNAIVADYNFSKEVIEQALTSRLDALGFGRSRSSKGFVSYSAVNWPGLSPDKVDVYYKVDGRKENSTVMMLVSKGYDNFITSAREPFMVDKVKAFLSDLVGASQMILHQEKVQEQGKNVITAQGKCADLQKDMEKLKSKAEDLQKELKRNQDDQNNLVQEQKNCEKALSAEQKKLEELSNKQ